MLFQSHHIEQIKSGKKTATRRQWDSGYNHPRIGSVQIAGESIFTSHEEADCYIRVLDVYQQQLGEMTDSDARKEGDYESVGEFKRAWEEINGEWDPEETVHVVEFEHEGSERPSP